MTRRVEARSPERPTSELGDLDGEPTWSAVKRISIALAKLLATLLPEVASVVLGAFAGLVVGLVAGVGWTSELLGGPGPWARVGPIALLVPVITLLGPTLVGLVVGVLAPLPIVAGLHALVLLPLERRDRHRVVLAVAVAYWLPFPVGLLASAGDRLRSAYTAVMTVGALFAGVALFASIVWLLARLVLRGRSVGAWWSGASRSMLVSAVLLTGLGAALVWLVAFLFPLLPIAPLALALGLVLALRVAWAGRDRGKAVLVALVAVLHLAVLVGATWVLVTSPGRPRPDAHDGGHGSLSDP